MTNTDAGRSHCSRGHLLDAPNLTAYGLRMGRRVCMACERASAWCRRRPEADIQIESDKYYADLGTGLDRMARRRALPPRRESGPASERANCNWGHPLAGANLAPAEQKRGRRTCRSCERASSYLRRHPEAGYQETSDRYCDEIMKASVAVYRGDGSGYDYGDPRFPSHFWEATYPEPNTGCWLWAGRAYLGYGRFMGLAHRRTYQRLVGPIPDGLEIDHLCRVTLCVNPAHLEPVTRLENQRRRYVLLTHCKNGHEYNFENTRFGGRTPTSRRCRRCQTIASRRCQERKRAKLERAT